MPRPPEQALRRMVADLAVADARDRQAVLEALDPSKRERVEALLSELDGAANLPRLETRSVVAPEAAEKSGEPNLEGLSAWLAVRVDREASPSIGATGPTFLGRAPQARAPIAPFKMTPAAVAALRRAVGDAPEVRAPEQPTIRMPSWLRGKSSGGRL